MSNFPGAIPAGFALLLAVSPGFQSNLTAIDWQFRPFLFTELVGSTATPVVPPLPTVTNFGGTTLFWDAGTTWFEILHVFPRTLVLGNVLAPVEFTITVYNAFTEQSQDWLTFTNNVGDGIEFVGLPTLPVTFIPQSGTTFLIRFLPLGPPAIAGTFDLTFSVPLTVEISASGSRIVAFPFRPEAPVRESLEFLTEIFERKNGTEQRVSLRGFPRRSFAFRVARTEGIERTRAEFLLFDWQAREFALPLWVEPAFLNAPASLGDFTVQVGSTDFASFAINGIAIVYTDETIFDILEIESLTANSITFKTALSRDYRVGTEVFPIRLAITEQVHSANRNPVGLAEYDITFRVTDNNPGPNFATATGWPLLLGRVLLDDPNAITGSLQEDFERRMIVLDNETGRIENRSPWDRHRRGNTKTFVVQTREQLWRIRRLLAFFRGRQVAFFMPTFWNELTVTDTLVNATAAMNIANVGYSRFVANRQPRDRIRITRTNGDVLIRQIVDSGTLDAETETLTVDTNWPETITPEEIRFVDLIELVRIDSDTIQIEHGDANGLATVTFPVRTVLQ